MTPESTSSLEAMVQKFRTAAHDRHARIANVPDDVLTKFFGLPQIAICRRLASHPRVARRIDRSLGLAMKARAEAIAKAEMEARRLAEEARQEEKRQRIAAGPIILLLEDAGLYNGLRYIAAAAAFASIKGFVSKETIAANTELYGDDAVTFGLASRADVPLWMAEVASGPPEYIWQMASTSMLSWILAQDHPEKEALIDRLMQYDPLPIGDPVSRSVVAALADRALTVLQAKDEEVDDV